MRRCRRILTRRTVPLGPAAGVLRRECWQAGVRGLSQPRPRAGCPDATRPGHYAPDTFFSRTRHPPKRGRVALGRSPIRPSLPAGVGLSDERWFWRSSSEVLRGRHTVGERSLNFHEGQRSAILHAI